MDRVAKAGILLTCMVLGAAGRAGGADKSRKPTGAEKSAESSNASIRTQQRTGDAMANKVARPTSEKTARTDPVEDLKAKLADVEARIRAEDERFADAISELRATEEAATKSGKAKSIAAARKAIEREKATHERKRSPLDEQRSDLRRKLKLDDEPAEAPAKPREAKPRAA